MAILTILSILYLAWGFLKEALEPPCPKGMWFDGHAYFDDKCRGMSSFDQLMKTRRGGYWVPAVPFDALVDVARYERDKEKFGLETAEHWRKRGFYRHKD